MAELRAPEQNRLLGQLARMLRTTEGDIAAPEFLPKGLDVMGLVRQLMLPSAETVEKLSYGDPLFRMPTQSNIPITADREYLADVVGMAPMVPAASRATTRLSNEAADQLVRAITRNPEATAPQVLEAAGQMLPMSRITTYHGSPYLFREFDPARVGTGEGAQAYGVGSGYTAEARNVAEGYRKGIKDMGSIKAINEKMDELVKVMESDSEYPGAYRKFKSEKGRKAAEEYDALIQQRSEIRNAPGYLYKGEIPDEILPSFLDWDKPLSQQSEEVRNALKRRVVNVVPQDKFDMGGNARLRDNRGGEVDPTSSQPWLLEATDASGTKFFGLTQKDVDRMFGAKDAKDLTGEQIYARLTQDQGSQQAASEYLNSIGVRGIRYLDQGSRSEGKGTSNFIPFQPEDYRIQEINDRPIGEFFPGLLDQPAQSVVENPLYKLTKEEFLGKPKIVTPKGSKDLEPRVLTTNENVDPEPFMGGKYSVKMSEDGAAVFDGDKVVASYNFGDTLVVNPKYRKRGIAEELVYQWRSRYPDVAKAKTRTKVSQNVQEKVWERIQNEKFRAENGF
jgi:hypothetical protein